MELLTEGTIEGRVGLITQKIHSGFFGGLDDLVVAVAKNIKAICQLDDLRPLFDAVTELQDVDVRQDAWMGDIGPVVYAFYWLAKRSDGGNLDFDAYRFILSTLEQYRKYNEDDEYKEYR